MTNMDRPTLKFGDMSLTNSIVFTVSREQAIDYGHVVPTAEEVAERNIQLRESWERSRETWHLYYQAREKLADVRDPVARRILDLHAPDSEEYPKCEGCDFGGYDGEAIEWPCRTVEAIADHFDIPLPTGYLGSRPGDEPSTMPPEGYKPFAPRLARWHTAAVERAFDSAVFSGEDKPLHRSGENDQS